MTAVATVQLPGWHPHPDVWLVVVALAGGYLYALRRHGPHQETAGMPAASRRQRTLFLGGVALLWAVSDWPVHDLGDHLFSFHMVEHLVLALVVAPLLIMGTPAWMARRLVGHRAVFPVLRALTKPLIAFFAFNVVLAAIHWPAVVRLMVTSEPAHIFIHAVLLAVAIIMWTPVLSQLSELPRLRPPVRMLYLFGHSLIPTVPASFLTFGKEPLYGVYAEGPRLWGIDPLTDQAVAGLIMKIGGGLLLWTVIAVIWFRWYGDEQRWEQIERELRAT